MSKCCKLACIRLIISDFILRKQKLGNYEVIRKTWSIENLFRINKPKVITDRTKAKLKF